MYKVNFIVGTQALYDAVSNKDTNSLYFISDTQRIYKGNVEVTQSVFPVVNFPENGIENKIYIHKNTLEVKIYSEGSWFTVNPGYAMTVETMKDAANGGKLATIDAIKDYIDEILAECAKNYFQDVQFDKTDGKVQFIGSEAGTVLKEAQLEGVAHDATFDSTNLRITIPQYGKDDLVVDIPRDNFLTDAYYDEAYNFEDSTTGPAIVLVVKTEGSDTDKRIAIPASAMTNDYTAGKTDTIQVEIGTDHKIKARLIIDASTSDGTLTIWDATAKKLGTTGVRINNDTTQEMGNSNEHIPTAAVVAAAIRKAYEELAGSLLAEGNANEVVISTANGIVRSGVVIGGATLSDSPDAVTLATEAAVLDAISWKTLA